MRLHDCSSSGNAYKVRLLLSLLDIGFERVEVDIDGGETRTDEFLAINPNGRIPVLFAYTHVAHEGGFELDAYPAIGPWIARCQAQPGFLSMND